MRQYWLLPQVPGLVLSSQVYIDNHLRFYSSTFSQVFFFFGYI